MNTPANDANPTPPRNAGQPQVHHVWIVEIRHHESGKWMPTVGCALDRENGRRKRDHWRRANPDDSFRLTRYLATQLKSP